MNKTKGFTLIELLVVIAIIGILASIVLASLDSARKKGRDARRIADIKQLQLALELYYDSCNAFPGALVNGIAGSACSGLVGPGYISVIPTDPGNNVIYAYVPLAVSSLATCQSYVLGATLESQGHSALNKDADSGASATTPPTGYQTCDYTPSGTPAAPASYTFNSGDGVGTKCRSTDSASNGCYDVRP